MPADRVVPEEMSLLLRDGETVVRRTDDGFEVVGTSTTRVYTVQSGLGGVPVRSMLEDHVGNLWLGTPPAPADLQVNNCKL